MLDGRTREERVGELGNMARQKRGLTSWRGGRGRNGLVSLEMWHVTNKDSPAGGEKVGGVAETKHITREDSPTGKRKREEPLLGLGVTMVGEGKKVTCVWRRG